MPKLPIALSEVYLARKRIAGRVHRTPLLLSPSLSARLGVSVYHMSNASIGDKNPGTEVVSLVFSWPLGPGN